MPKMIDDSELSNLSTERLLTQCVDDICEIMVAMIANIKNILANASEFEKLSSQSGLFISLNKEFAQYQNAPDMFSLARKFFNGGKVDTCYHMTKTFISQNAELLRGIEITLEKIEACHNGLTELDDAMAVLPSNYNLIVDKVHQLFVDAKSVSQTNLQGIVQVLQKNYDDLACNLKNHSLVIAEIRQRLSKALTLLILITANKAGLDFDQAFTEQTLFERLSTMVNLAKPLQFLSKNMSNPAEVLFSMMQAFKTHADYSREIDNFHQNVIRTRYITQGLSLAAQFNGGYCGGGIRHWATLTTSNKRKVSFKHHYELHESEPDKQALHMKYNSDTYGQKYQSSNCFIHKVQSKKTSIISLDEIIDTLENLANIYNYQATFQLDLFHDQEQGHAVGFKITEELNKHAYFFCDYNTGEFVTEDRNALKIWLGKLFALFAYTGEKNSYDLYVIRRKNNVTQHPMKQALKGLSEQMPTLDTNTKITPLQKAFTLFQKSNDMTEMQDNLLRDKIKVIIPKFDDDEKMSVLMKQYFELYDQISQRNAGDYILAFILKLRSIKYLQFSSRHDVFLQLQAVEQIAKSMKLIDSTYHTIDRYRWICMASFYIQGISRDVISPQDELIDCLEKFCKSCRAIKEDELYLDNGFEDLCQARLELENLLAASFISKHAVANVISRIEEIFENEYPLWMTEPLIEIYMNLIAGEEKIENCCQTS